MFTTPKSRFSPAPAAPKAFLATMEIFGGMPVEALRDIERQMTEKKFIRQQSILLEGDLADKVWFVKEGHVKAMVHAPNGRCQTLCMVGAKQMFGTCCALSGDAYLCHVVAETDVAVVSLPLAYFTALLGKYPSIGTALVAQISRRLRLSKEGQSFEQESVEKRILHTLLSLVEEFGNTIPLTRREVAEMAGTTVETCIRTFSRFEQEGLVSTARGRIIVKDMKAVNRRLELV